VLSAGSFGSSIDDGMAQMLRGNINAGIAPARQPISSIDEFGRRGVVDLCHGRPSVEAAFRTLEVQLRHTQALQEAQRKRVVNFKQIDGALRCGVFVCGPMQLAKAAGIACERANALARIQIGL